MAISTIQIVPTTRILSILSTCQTIPIAICYLMERINYTITPLTNTITGITTIRPLTMINTN